MALVLADRVQEATTTSGTGTLTLSGAVPGYQTFLAGIGSGNTTFYTIYDTVAFSWEVGIGTVGSGTLSRDTVLSNSLGTTAKISLAGNSSLVFVTYPAGKSVNLDASGNVGPLGTISSGTWNGSTIGVAYGGTGVTASSGANSVVLRDANQNITVNRLNQGLQTTTASGGTTTLTVASQFNQALVGTGGQTFKLPDATTLSNTTAFQFNNNATGTLTIVDNASGPVGTVAPGGAAGIALLSNATIAGTWDVHAYIPENVTWGTNALALGSTVITGGTWNGNTIGSGYGGTGLTTFTAANYALYSTSASALTAGTLPVVAGGTGQTTYTNGQLLIGNSTGNTLTKATLTQGTGISITNGSGAITITNSAPDQTVAISGTSPVSVTGTYPNFTVSMTQSSGSVNGWLSSTDWTTFNSKQAAYTNLTSIGSLANGAGWLYNNGSGTFSYSTPTKTDVGLGNVTNDTQTKAAIVPNTAPTSGQILVGNAGGTAYAPVSASGDATLASTGALTLATVNSNVGSFTNASVTVNAKGLVTAVSSGTAPVTTFSAGTTGFTPSSATSGAVTLSGTLNVANGGTGLTSLTANYIPYGNGTSAYQSSSTFTYNGTTLTASNFSTGGNLTFTGTGNRITGDFSNATLANRVAFQTSTTNSFTIVSVIPNGSGSASSVLLENNSTYTNSGYLQFSATSSASNIISGIRGTGSYLPMTFSTGGSEAMRIDTSGNVGIGNTPSGTYKLEVTGNGYFSTGVTLGTALAVGSGGTGQTSYTDGQLLIGNSTGNTLTKATLTAGSGISITNGSGSITIASTASGATITNDTSTATNQYPLFAAATSGTLSTVYTSNAKYLYKPSTGELTSPVVSASNGIIVNSKTVSTSYSIPSGSSAMSAGPITVASGQSVTVPSGSRWVVL